MQANESPDCQQSAGPAAKSSLNIHEARWYSILSLVLSAISLIAVVMLQNDREEDRRAWDRQFNLQLQQYRETERASALLERRYIDMESYAMLNGWKVPRDDRHGPTGNLERMFVKETTNGRK